MVITPLQEGSMKDALELVELVFQEFEAPDYSEEGVNSFRDFIRYDSIMERIHSGEMNFWGCFHDQELAGVIAARGPSHISLLFVKQEYQRQGIAKKLFQTLLDHCKTAGHKECITVNSSPYAVEIYHRLGFRDTDREQTVNGIRFTPMKYSIEKNLRQVIHLR